MKLVQLGLLACLFAINVATLEATGDELTNADEKVVCAVCLDQCTTTTDNTMVPRALECGHVFHAACVGGWICQSPHAKCPLCRVEIRDLALRSALIRAAGQAQLIVGQQPIPAAAPPAAPVTIFRPDMGWDAADWDAACRS